MAYTTQALVESSLEQIDVNSKPNEADITEWISEVESEIDQTLGTSFTTNTSTDEYHDYNPDKGYLILKKSPVIAVSALAYNSAGLGSTANWVSLTEGQANDYLLYADISKIKVHSLSYSIPYGYQNIKVTYTWGRSSVPKIIQRLATYMVVDRYLEVKMNEVRNKSPVDMTMGEVRIRHSFSAVKGHIDMFWGRVDRLYGALGKLKTRRQYWND